MHITKLRLLGFKSFVEPSELVIEHGLTGVVGPNGCGKSNLLEGLRWVMGETSFKNMRGSAMDDVIFAGTNTRPQRDAAEVTIFLDNSKRTAPSGFNDADMIEVTRRIEREAGSAYKINGQDVRARDVQLLFADASTGARSPALVQQGRIGEIVNSKPQARRRILEEAAGITGLYSRRHEAELRLKAAENNLERLQDIKGQIGTQLNSLKRQARQAKRYKEISTHIQQAEAIQFHLSWVAAGEAVTKEEQALQEAMRAVGQYTQEESAALRAQTTAATAMQPLRDEEAIRAAVLHRMEMERDTLDREEARSEERRKELETQISQLEGDLVRERGVIEDSKTDLERLVEEETTLKQATKGQGDAEQKAKSEASDAKTALTEAETAFNITTSETAEARAKHNQLTQTLEETERKISWLKKQSSDYGEQLETLQQDLSAVAEMEKLTQEVERLSTSITDLEESTLAAEKKAASALEEENNFKERVNLSELTVRQLETEIQTLIKLLSPAKEADWQPIVDHISVEAGYEMALGAALGDDIDASSDEGAPVYWGALQGNTVLPPLPIGVAALIRFVDAPDELGKRLAMTGVVDRADGKTLQPNLSAGQKLVSREGDIWRWDGFTAAADAPTASAKRLSEKNRLVQMESEASDARQAAAKLAQELETLSQTATTAKQEEKRLREEWRDGQAQLGRARDAVSASEKKTQDSIKRLAGITEAQTQLAVALNDTELKKTETDAAVAALAPIADLENTVETNETKLQEARTRHSEAHAAVAGIEREARLRQERIHAIGEERARWQNRTQSADTQITFLKTRAEKSITEVEKVRAFPALVAERRGKILSEISKSEQSRKEAADKLAQAETALRDFDKALRELQNQLATAREDRARIEARLEAARDRRSDQARMIRDNLSCAPEECLSLANLEDGETIPAISDIESKLIKLKADRERLGGVNLRAEQEAGELTTQVDEMERESQDLEEAISKLRQGIASLNREGGKRLLEAFDQVNVHFKRLFTVLFGGGEAELQLIESDDPLQAGLEILARPPGKKAQVLTLLSGGEKALTALSLIFAVFLTNPSPICVLDEVDAPLDDANVDRFCTMMEEMRKSTDTRFLVITHHPMTMARMNRLFGVTMSEKGVSQLVSVDLATAEGFREAS